MNYLGDLQGLGLSIVFFIGAVILGFVAHVILFRILKRISKKTENVLDDSFVRHFKRPSQFIIPLLCVSLFSPVIGFSPGIGLVLGRLISIFWVIAIAWLIIQVPGVINDFVLDRYKIDVKDNLKARKIHTQFQVFRKVVIPEAVPPAIRILKPFSTASQK